MMHRYILKDSSLAYMQVGDPSIVLIQCQSIAMFFLGRSWEQNLWRLSWHSWTHRLGCRGECGSLYHQLVWEVQDSYQYLSQAVY